MVRRSRCYESRVQRFGTNEDAGPDAVFDEPTASMDPAAARIGTNEEPTGTRHVPVGRRSVQAKIGGARQAGGTSLRDGDPGRRGGMHVARMIRTTDIATSGRRAAQEEPLVKG